MSWLDKIVPTMVKASKGGSSRVPEGLWKKCVKCASVLYRPELERNLDVCPKCDHHFRIGARRRLDMFLDEDNREELATDVLPVDRLNFKDIKKYKDRLSEAQKKTGEKDALVAIKGSLNGQPVVAVAFEFSFHGGSMGYVVGEKFTRAAQVSLEENIPFVCFSATGGARMQEALISLMQMAMGDINAAEPGARAGFAGPAIIEQTIRQKLPKGFQRSEFLLEHGAIDTIIHRKELRDTLSRMLAKFTYYTSSKNDDVVEEVLEPSEIIVHDETPNNTDLDGSK